MRILKNLFLTMYLASATTALANPAKESKIETVKAFVEAFNQKNSQAMAEFVSEDVKWLSISGESLQLETSGKHDLIKSMDSYFKSCPSCQSELSALESISNQVSAIETARWQSKDGLKSQSAISVYEFEGDVITRVYYFSAQN